MIETTTMWIFPKTPIRLLPHVFEGGNRKSMVLQALLAVFCVSGSSRAGLIQHLDATFSSGVSGNPVTQWKDQSGMNNHAVKNGGTVSYPSTSAFASGNTGLKFGPSYSSMTLFPSDSWLNQTTGNGFCVLVAFKVDAINPGVNNDVLGNDDAVNSGALGLRYLSDGTMSASLGKISCNKSGQRVTSGDTIVYAVNYHPMTGMFEFWDSKNYDSLLKKVWPGDFSVGQSVVLGYTGHTGRFLNGLVGEVKIYNTAMGADLFKAEREAMASKWANVANMSEISWRVIPEDPDYPTDDVITAAISVDDDSLINQLPADPANKDCTATFQEAIDTVSQANGGTVWIPEGEYRFDNNLILRSGVSLRGRWDRPSATGWNAGTILKIYHGEGGTTDDAPFITAAGGSTFHIKDLTFWHPNQSPTNVKPYPYVVLGLGGPGTFENLTFVNAYRGINQDAAGFGLVRGMYGTMLETGLMSDHGAAVPRFESLYAGSQYWEWWPLDNVVADPEQPGNYAHFMITIGTFFRIRNMDVFSFYNADISGYSVGMVMENSDGSSLNDGNVPNHGQVSGVNIHDCRIALQVKAGNFSSGMKSTFSGSQYGIHSSTGGSIPLTECLVSGGLYAVYNEAGSGFSLNARSCTIDGPVRFEDGTMELKACDFTRSGTHVSVTSGIDRGVVAGCTYNKTQQVTIVGSFPQVAVDHTPLNYKPLPEYKINPLTDFNTVRKPARTNLYNVVAYGARGDGITDDTVAVTAAMNAAKLNGGGIVFFPFGDFGRYRITENLNLGTGIELRGIGTRGPPNEWKGQSIIQIEKYGPADGMPFITMGDGCGVRGGLVFWYPGNNWNRILNGGEGFTPYPYTIYANGTNNYIIACSTPNPYQFVDFDGATDPLVDMMLTGGLRTVYRVRGGTTGCRITTGHVKPSGMWGLLTDITNNKYNYTLFGIETTKTVEIFDLDDCEDVMILAMFCREAHKALTCNGAQGMVVGTAGEAVQNGFCFERAGATPLYMIDTKPNMSEHGTGSGKPGILVEPTYHSTLDILGGAEQGAADYKFKVLSGNVYSQSRKNVNSGWAQLRGILVDGDAQLTLYDNILDHPFSLNVGSNATLKIERSYFPAGIPYATIDGSLVVTNSDINKNCILSVPGQTQFSQHGLILATSNTVRAKRQWSWSENLASGDSFNLDVTESAFTNSKVKNGDINIGIYLGESGSNTVNVYYDSDTGERLGKTQTFNDLDGRVKVVSFSVSDARFGSATSDIRIQVSNPAEAGLSYIWVRGNPAIEPPLDLTATAGASSISLDWKGKSHWQFDSYSVHRSTVSGGPYTQIATDLTATAFTDDSVASNTAYYYVVKTVDSSGNETSPSTEVMASATPAYSYYTYIGGTGSWETSGQWSSGAAWNGPFFGTLHVPSSIGDVTLGMANVTLNSTTTLDEYRVGDAGASPSGAGSLTLNPGSVLNTRQGSVGYNRGATLMVLSGAQLNHSADVVIGYRGRTTVDVHGTLTQRDLKLQFSGANPRAAASVINVFTGGVITVSRNLQIGGDDGTANFTGLSGTLNIHTGGLVRALGWDLRKGARIVLSEGGQLKINGDQVTVANGYIATGYLTSAAQISVIYDDGLDETLISAAEPASGYNVWASANGVGIEIDDDDGDGWANLLEYAIGGDPNSGGDAAPAIEITGSSLEYSYRKRNNDANLNYILQGCVDLKSWEDLDSAGIIDSTDGVYDNVTHAIPAGESPYFIRLRVTTQ